MLVAVLNTCTKEELEESDEELALISHQVAPEDSAERRKVIKNKIMAVGRMARVFALLRYVPLRLLLDPKHWPVNHREESEKVSELKSASASGKLPYGTLASGMEGLKEAIQGFDDAWVFTVFHVKYSSHFRIVVNLILKMSVFHLSSLMLIRRRVKL